MRRTVWLAIGMGLVAGCSAQRSSGVAPLADGTYRITVASRNLGGATQQALSEASAHCGGRGEQAQMLRRQINPADYDLVFRCANAATPSRGGAAPILLGSAAPAGPAVPAMMQTAVLPAEPPTLAALQAAAGSRLPPVPDLPPLQPLPQVDRGPVFAPLPSVQNAAPTFSIVPDAPPRASVPRAYESLPPVTGMPGGPPQRALAPLPPIAEPALAGPPPRQGAASATPPSAFWEARRN
ncbi:hypothetical protein JMJ56_04090 [Belnapia sp. T18]|uniref:Uncharacterized protein n=1 Tax=Belnapia arida TaxID=2804533 RepID=A0ABS1TXP5_9PROT|nr:hypothetical protein [Belnapia arida]MBL6077174.1 hypothetical protein [Belnapia arida]